MRRKILQCFGAILSGATVLTGCGIHKPAEKELWRSPTAGRIYVSGGSIYHPPCVLLRLQTLCDRFLVLERFAALRATSFGYKEELYRSISGPDARDIEDLGEDESWWDNFPYTDELANHNITDHGAVTFSWKEMDSENWRLEVNTLIPEFSGLKPYDIIDWHRYERARNAPIYEPSELGARIAIGDVILVADMFDCYYTEDNAGPRI